MNNQYLCDNHYPRVLVPARSGLGGLFGPALTEVGTRTMIVLTCAHARAHAHTQVHTHACTHKPMHMNTHMYTHACTYTCMHTRIQKHTHTHVHYPHRTNAPSTHHKHVSHHTFRITHLPHTFTPIRIPYQTQHMHICTCHRHNIQCTQNTQHIQTHTRHIQHTLPSDRDAASDKLTMRVTCQLPT